MGDVVRELQSEADHARHLLRSVADITCDDDELIDSTIEGETNLKEAVTRAYERVIELEGFNLSLDAQREQLDARKARNQRQIDRIKNAIVAALAAASVKSLETAERTYTRRKVPPKPILTHEADIPHVYMRQPEPPEPKPDMRKITAALRDGISIPGVVLSNGSETLAVRVA